MSLKKYEELKNINLRGYCYYEDAWGMTMTSRHAYDPERWVVIEDDGEKCTVARYNKEANYDRSRTWTNTPSKDYVAKRIHSNPCISKDGDNFIQDITKN